MVVKNQCTVGWEAVRSRIKQHVRVHTLCKNGYKNGSTGRRLRSSHVFKSLHTPQAVRKTRVGRRRCQDGLSSFHDYYGLIYCGDTPTLRLTQSMMYIPCVYTNTHPWNVLEVLTRETSVVEAIKTHRPMWPVVVFLCLVSAFWPQFDLGEGFQGRG